MTCAIPTVLLNDIDSSITIVLEYIKLEIEVKIKGGAWTWKTK
jgi:hypothetical protein